MRVVEMRMFRWMDEVMNIREWIMDKIMNEYIREKMGVASIEEKMEET